MHNTRDLLNHGAGKGDKPRTKLDSNYLKRFESIRFPGRVDGLVRRGHKLIKRYGRPSRPS